MVYFWIFVVGLLGASFCWFVRLLDFRVWFSSLEVVMCVFCCWLCSFFFFFGPVAYCWLKFLFLCAGWIVGWLMFCSFVCLVLVKLAFCLPGFRLVWCCCYCCLRLGLVSLLRYCFAELLPCSMSYYKA